LTEELKLKLNNSSSKSDTYELLLSASNKHNEEQFNKLSTLMNKTTEELKNEIEN
jgi:hypothetical protein